MNVDKDTRLQTLAGQIYPAEGRVLRSLAAAVRRDRLMVELGAGRGKSACYLSTGSAEGFRARLLSIDLWDKHSTPEARRRGALARRMFDLQLELEGEPWLVTARRGRTDSPPAPGLAVGLLFVDGGHTYEQVGRDLAAWLPSLAPGAVIAMHDWVGGFDGVARAGREVLGEPADIVETMAVFR